MSVDPEIMSQFQLALFDFHGTSSQAFELFPKVWVATEALADREASSRHAGLDALVELNAARYSPLVAYMIFTRIEDPDLPLRIKVVNTLAKVLLHDETGQFAPEIVRQSLLSNLSQLKSGQIIGILEAAEFEPNLEENAAILLKANCTAGNVMADILVDRKSPIGLRQQAANMIARVGFVEAIPSIERLVTRLETRKNGQQSYLYSQQELGDEIVLLPLLRSVLSILLAP